MDALARRCRLLEAIRDTDQGESISRSAFRLNCVNAFVDSCRLWSNEPGKKRRCEGILRTAAAFKARQCLESAGSTMQRAAAKNDDEHRLRAARSS